MLQFLCSRTYVTREKRTTYVWLDLFFAVGLQTSVLKRYHLLFFLHKNMVYRQICEIVTDLFEKGEINIDLELFYNFK